MAILNTYTKQPADYLDYDIEYDEFLIAGDALASVVSSVSDPTLVVDATIIIGTRVKLWISGGVDRRSYKVTVTVTTSQGRVKQDELMFRVRDY